MSTLTRRELLRNACAGAALAAGLSRAHAERAAAKDTRPNIVFLLSDDQRWDSLGCTGNPICKTPHLDALAADGVLFTNHFSTTPICMTSRASIFTGLHTRCHGIEDFSLPLSPALWDLCYPARIRGAGYHAGFIGKWGLGGDLPEAQFDYWKGFPAQGKYFPDGEPGPHLNNIMGDQAIEFIQSAPKGKPFCLSVSFKAPHVQDEDLRQYLYDPALEDLYKDITIPPPSQAHSYFYNRMPEFNRTSEGRKRWQLRFSTSESYQRSVKGYYRLITGMDLAVGRIMAALEKNGMEQSTVVVFTSDQGVFNGERGLAGKWLMHEESIRAPLIIHDPRVRGRLRGRRCDAMTLNIDFSPTLLSLAGEPVPPPLQGRDLGPLVRGEHPRWRTECFFEHHFGGTREPVIPASEAIRTPDWKYIRYVEPQPLYQELYDLENDPKEMRNHACEARFAAVQESLTRRWQAWRDALDTWRADMTEPWKDPVAREV